MSNKDDPHKQILAAAQYRPFVLLLFLVILLFPLSVDKALEIAPEPQKVYFKAVSPIKVIKPISLASVSGGSGDLLGGLVFKSLIKCLNAYESGGNDFAKGDPYANQTPERKLYCDNPLFPSEYCAFGRLQFWQRTWFSKCEGDIFNPRDQFVCADRLLMEDWNNRFMWTSVYKCLAD